MWIFSCPSIICWKEYFSALSGLGTLLKIIDPEYKGLYLDFQFCSIDLSFGQHHTFDSSNFGVSAEIRKGPSSSFVLIVLWVSYISVGILGSVHQFLQKRLVEFWWIVLTLWIDWLWVDLLAIVRVACLPSHEHQALSVRTSCVFCRWFSNLVGSRPHYTFKHWRSLRAFVYMTWFFLC